MNGRACWCADPGRTEDEMYQCPAGDAGEECLAHDLLATGGALHTDAPFFPRVDLSDLRQAIAAGEPKGGAS